MSKTRLINGDCIDVMQKLIEEEVEVDMVLTDIPYGTTSCKWDTIIPFDDMWECINGLCHDRTPVLLFGNEPFSSTLRVSNLKCYKYDWVWNKEVATNFMNAKKMPLKPLEYISVFYRKAPTYNPIRRPKTIDYDATRTSDADKRKVPIKSDVCGTKYKKHFYVDDGTRYPINLITINNQKGECNNMHRVHPTQKPVELMEYFVRTYTNEGDLVLDFTMGSGSTGVACRNLNRDFIGIELDKDYFEVAKKRINSTQSKLL